MKIKIISGLLLSLSLNANAAYICKTYANTHTTNILSTFCTQSSDLNVVENACIEQMRSNGHGDYEVNYLQNIPQYCAQRSFGPSTVPPPEPDTTHELIISNVYCYLFKSDIRDINSYKPNSIVKLGNYTPSQLRSKCRDLKIQGGYVAWQTVWKDNNRPHSLRNTFACYLFDSQETLVPTSQKAINTDNSHTAKVRCDASASGHAWSQLVWLGRL